MIKFVLIAYVMLAGLLPTFTAAAPAILNSTGGTNSTNGLKIYVDPSTQIQVLSSGSGQLYSPNATPPSNVLDNGIYIRANGTLYGPDNFAYNASGNYTSTSVGTVTPSTASQGVVQTTTSTFALPNSSSSVAGPNVQIIWSYTYPYTFVTATVTITIPSQYPVSSSNPVRYYHAVDTYLGGSDCGCGVRYVDTNGHQVAGTYPLSGSSCSSGGSTSTTCPSSTSLPPNLNIVESFRERNGSFSHYCVGSWSTFWSNSTSDACAIGKSTTLADTVNTKLMDTGAAIEYDFTAPGTYTFSYDFVVGSTAVPNYDHLEVQHAGSATLCPTTVQVLACTSSTVPCPSDSIVNTGSLTGSLTFTPTIPSVSQTPSSFQVSADGASVATVTLQASGAGTVVFGATGLSKLPQNGVKCWNTATSSQTCNFVFTNTPCVSTFECMESSLTYNNLQTNSALRNPIYTKVLASSFNLDVVAVLANGSQSSGYNATTGLIVDLVTDSGGSCSSNVVATKLVSFATSDSGRKTVGFSSSDVIAANANLRCRVRDLTLGVTGCSSDNFSMRPQSFTISSSNATQLSPGPSSTPVFRAGRDYFNLIASTGELGYTGTPVIDNSKLLAHSGAPAVGQANGSFPAANLGVSSGSTFTYSEVGHFQFLAQGVYDSTFTAVDSAKGDCDNTSSPFNNAGSGTPTMYGCRFGNTASSNYFGRFIPDHFLVTPGSGVTQACGAFTYYGQDSATSPGFSTPFTLTAQNAANGTTQNYTGSYASFVLSNWNNYQFSASPLNGATLTASSVSPAVTGTWNNGIASVVANHMLSRPASAVSPQTITISAQPQYVDSGVTVSSTQTVLSSNVPYRYGRLYLYNAHGSELLALPVQVETQYWNGSAYIRSLGDSCTSIPLSTIVMQNYKGNLTACETYLTGTTIMSNGVLGLKLTAPGVSGSGQPNTGSVDLEVNLGTAASTDKTCLSNAQSAATSGSLGWFGTNPTSRASFGIYKAPVIYMRENF